MTRGPLPAVSNSTDAFLAALISRQDEVTDLLTRILDRLPAPVSVEMQKPGTVELREPASVSPVDAQPEPAEELSEPAQPKPARRASRTRTTTKKARGA